MGNDIIIFQWKAETEKVYNPFGYCGEYTDEETGLVYLRNRYYDSSTGRFITEDPVKDGVNWYAYCSGNPIRYLDPFGLYELYVQNNKVCAFMESGDTLSSISKSEVNDANAWKKINYSGNTRDIPVGAEINITSIYNENYPINNVISSISNYYPETRIDISPSNQEIPFITFDIHFGYGLEAEIKLGGMGITLGGKSYYSLSDVATNLSITTEGSAEISIFDDISLGATGYTKLNTSSLQQLERAGYAGLKIGNNVIGIDMLKDKKDFVLSGSLGLYLGAGGDISVDINVSELFRRFG